MVLWAMVEPPVPTAAVDLKNDRVVVILTQAGSKNARPLIGGGHKLAMEILAKENKR